MTILEDPEEFVMPICLPKNLQDVFENAAEYLVRGRPALLLERGSRILWRQCALVLKIVTMGKGVSNIILNLYNILIETS